MTQPLHHNQHRPNSQTHHQYPPHPLPTSSNSLDKMGWLSLFVGSQAEKPRAKPPTKSDIYHKKTNAARKASVPEPSNVVKGRVFSENKRAKSSSKFPTLAQVAPLIRPKTRPVENLKPMSERGKSWNELPELAKTHAKSNGVPIRLSSLSSQTNMDHKTSLRDSSVHAHIKSRNSEIKVSGLMGRRDLNHKTSLRQAEFFVPKPRGR